jgi:hypothetical protein
LGVACLEQVLALDALSDVGVLATLLRQLS